MDHEKSEPTRIAARNWRHLPADQLDRFYVEIEAVWDDAGNRDEEGPLYWFLTDLLGKVEHEIQAREEPDPADVAAQQHRELGVPGE